MISKIVKNILEQDEVAKKSLIRGILNLSAYARSIRKEVEGLYGEIVSDKSIVMALSRIRKNLNVLPTYDFKIDSFYIYPNLVEVSGGLEIEGDLMSVYLELDKKSSNGKFLTFTKSTTEVCLIVDRDLWIEKECKVDKKYEFIENLVGVSLKFSKEYLEIPGLIFYVLKLLEYKSINVVELVSTLTEITFLVDKKDTDKVLRQLNMYL